VIRPLLYAIEKPNKSLANLGECLKKVTITNQTEIEKKFKKKNDLFNVEKTITFVHDENTSPLFLHMLKKELSKIMKQKE
jgi:hypothetical protein